MVRLLTFAAVILLTSALGCDSGIPASPNPHLYERMGGQPGVTAIVDSFYDMLKQDPMMMRTFEGMFNDETGQRADRFKTMMRGLMCYMGDGGCWYVGLSMYAAHAHMDITEDEYGAMMDHLDRAMAINDIGADERKEMIDLFNELKADIVQ
jgi:hemoglobin